jgi:hypothetical protein
MKRIVGLMVMLAAAPVAAQDFIANQAPVMAGIANTAAMNSVLRTAYGRSDLARTKGPQARRSVELGYRVTPELARQAVDGFLARASRTSPDGARVYREQFAQHDYRSIYRGLIAGAGLRLAICQPSNV